MFVYRWLSMTCANPEVRGTQAFAAWLQANGHLD
jgi:hypothetical protein